MSQEEINLVLVLVFFLLMILIYFIGKANGGMK